MPSLVLIVEDDDEYRDWLKKVLTQAGRTCETACTIKTARERLAANTPDLILLDDGLPDGRGTELCETVRRNPRLSRTIVALLTGQRRLVDDRRWFDAGADSCWLKTHKSERLVALVDGLLRRHAWDAGAAPPASRLRVDLLQRKVSFDNSDSGTLSARELAFIELLLERQPDVVARDVIKERIFASSQPEQPDLALNEFIRRLRRKLPPPLARSVEAVHGRGYRFSPPERAV